MSAGNWIFTFPRQDYNIANVVTPTMVGVTVSTTSQLFEPTVAVIDPPKFENYFGIECVSDGIISVGEKIR